MRTLALALAALTFTATTAAIAGAGCSSTKAAAEPGTTPDNAAAPRAEAGSSGDAGGPGARVDAGPDAPSGERILFDGTDTSAWKMAGAGSFTRTGEGTLVTEPGNGLGLYWHTVPTPPDFVLTLEWMRTAVDDNSGVFVRFPDPDSKGYENTAWVAVHFGFEIQIDETGGPDGANVHKTAAIYDKVGQMEPRTAAKSLGEWNTYAIRVQGTSYEIRLNDVLVTAWSHPPDPDPEHPGRGAPSTSSVPRYVGLQTHTGRIAFRNVRLRAI